MIEQASASLLGATAPAIRRRALSRSFSHGGMKVALDKLRGATVNASVDALFRAARQATPVPVPRFAREISIAFVDAQSKREDADYDLGKRLSESDARQLRSRAKAAIAGWEAATSTADRDFKHSVCVSLLAKGALRPGRD